MSRNSYTPGPWVRHEPSGYQHSMGGYILGSDGKVCDVSGFDVGSEAAKENAKLIAAAPELLEALQEIVAMNVQYCLDKYGDSSKADTMACVTTARAAIAKALGQ